jgi:hypothetical protein
MVRASWLPANIVDGLGELDRITRFQCSSEPRRSSPEISASGGGKACTTFLQGRAAIGSGLIRIDGDTPAQAAVIERLRGSSLFGNVVVLRGSDALKAVVDVWGSHGDRQPLFDSLKHAFDPNGVLNAGRGPV